MVKFKCVYQFECVKRIFVVLLGVQIVKTSNSKLKKTAVIKKLIKSEPSEKIADKFTDLMEAEVVAKYATSFLKNS